MTFYLSMLLTLYSIEGKIMACFEIVSDRIDPMLKNPFFQFSTTLSLGRAQLGRNEKFWTAKGAREEVTEKLKK